MRARLDDPRLVHVSADCGTLSKSKRGTVGGVDSQDEVRVSCQVPEPVRREHHSLVPAQFAQAVEQICEGPKVSLVHRAAGTQSRTMLRSWVQRRAGLVEEQETDLGRLLAHDGAHERPRARRRPRQHVTTPS